MGSKLQEQGFNYRKRLRSKKKPIPRHRYSQEHEEEIKKLATRLQ
jgi:hypothetical protein